MKKHLTTKNLAITIVVLLAVYIIIGSIDSRKSIDDADLIPTFTKIDEKENIAVALESMVEEAVAHRLGDAPRDELVVFLDDASSQEISSNLRDIIHTRENLINRFETAITLQKYQNPFINNGQPLVSDLKIPSLGIYFELSQLSLARTKMLFLDSQLSRQSALARLNTIEMFGEKIQEGTSALIETIFGVKLSRQARNIALSLGLRNDGPFVMSAESKIRPFQYEYTMIKNGTQNLPSMLDFEEYPEVRIYKTLFGFPFLFHKNRTLGMIHDSFKYQIAMLQAGDCEAVSHPRSFWWTEWLTPNAAGKWLVSNYPTIQNVFCEK